MNGMYRLMVVFVLLSAALAARGADVKLADVVKIEFPKGGYTFTCAEAAKGIKLKYKIVVTKDVEGVIAVGNAPSYHEPAGPSGLHPRERIAGKGHGYCLLDFGLGAPPKEVAKKLKKGTYEHSFEWDGRSWSGPSDTGRPKGKAFPAGTYEVTVILNGKLVTDKGKVPYSITNKTKLVLK
jgi:hypothetical protein